VVIVGSLWFLSEFWGPKIHKMHCAYLFTHVNPMNSDTCGNMAPKNKLHQRHFVYVLPCQYVCKPNENLIYIFRKSQIRTIFIFRKVGECKNISDYLKKVAAQ